MNVGLKSINDFLFFIFSGEVVLTKHNNSALVHELPSRRLLDGINGPLHKLWNMLNSNNTSCLSNLGGKKPGGCSTNLSIQLISKSIKKCTL